MKLRKAPEREGGEETLKDVELEGPWQGVVGEAGGGFSLPLGHEACLSPSQTDSRQLEAFCKAHRNSLKQWYLKFIMPFK